MARLIGEAYISLLPDASLFRAKADAELKRDTAGMKVTVPITGDTGDIDRKIAALVASLKGLKGKAIIDGDATGALTTIADLYLALQTLKDRAEDIPVDLSDARGLAKIFNMVGNIDGMMALLEKVEEKGIDFNINKGIAKVYTLMGDVEDLEKASSHLTADFDVAAAEAKFGELRKGVGWIDQELRNLQANVRDSKYEAKIVAMFASAKKLADRLENMPVTADVLLFAAEMAKMVAQVDALRAAMNLDPNIDIATGQDNLRRLGLDVAGLQDELAGMRAGVSEPKFLAQIAAMQVTAQKLADRLKDMPVTANILPFEAELFKLQAVVGAFKAKTAEPVKIAFTYSLPGTTKGSNPFEYGTLNVSGFTAAEAQQMDLLAKATLGAMTDVERLGEAFKDTSSSGGIAAGVLAAFSRQSTLIVSSGLGNWWGFLNAKIRTFGGLFGNLLPGLLSSTHVWHLLGDAIFEVAAAWGPALIAVGAFTAYAIPAGEKIYGQWSNINTIIDGVGGKLPDLGSGFDKVEKAIEPSILEAFGLWMGVVTNDSGFLAGGLAKVGVVIDKLALQFASWADTGKKVFSSILSSGASDFEGLSRGFISLGKIFGAFFREMPGYVHILLALGDAFLAGTANLLTWAGPLLGIGLKIHGFIVYVGLAVTAVYALGRAMAVGAIASYARTTGAALGEAGDAAVLANTKFNRFGRGIGSFLGFLVGIPVAIAKYGASLVALAGSEGIAAAGNKILADGFGLLPGVTVAASSEMAVIEGELVAVGTTAKASGSQLKVFGLEMSALEFGAVTLGLGTIAAIIGVSLYFAFKRGGDAAASFNTQIQHMIATSNAANIGANLSKGIQETVTQIGSFNKAYGNLVNNVNARGGGVWATGQQQEYTSGLKTVIGDTQTYGSRMAQLTTIFGSNGAALQALSMIGVGAGNVATENNKTWAQQLHGLEALAQGYGYMGQQAGAAGNQLDALNISTGTTEKNIQTLISAESAWVTLSTSGLTAFSSFEQGQATLTSALKGGATSGATLSVTVGKITKAYSLAGTAMQGTSVQALAAQQAFAQQLSSGVTLYGNLQNLAAASGNTAAAQAQLGKAGKDIIAQMLPFVAGNKQATAQLSDLAQLMGGPATDNFQTLAKWVGNTKGAESDLYNEQAKLNLSMSNLSTAAKNLGNALDTSITDAQAAAIAKTANLTGATNGLAEAAKNAHGQLSTQVELMSGQYVTALHNSGIGTKDATQYLNAYLTMLHYTPSQIQSIDSQLGDSVSAWNKYDTAVNRNAKAAANFKTDTTANENALKAINGTLAASTGYWNSVWAALVKEDASLVTSGNHAAAAKTQFVNFAHNGLGVSTSAADALWKKFGQQNLTTLASQASSTKTAFINMAENGLKLTKTQAAQLWNEFTLQNLDMLASKGNNAKSAFINLAEKGLDLSKASAGNLWTTLTQQYLDTVAGKAGETKGAFEKLASQFDVDKGKADALWQSLHNIAAGSPYSAQVNVNESITQSLTTVPGTANPGIGVVLPKKAAGGILSGPGPSGKDGPIFQGAPGELVIPASHAALAAPMAKKWGIPGFTGGGVIGSYAAGGVPGSSSGSSSGGVPYSYAESGAPAFVSGNGSDVTVGQMQPMTQSQGMILLNQVQKMVTLLQQAPAQYANAVNHGMGQGAQKAYYS